MTLYRKVQLTGGSFLVVIPTHLAQCMGIGKGTTLSIALEQNKLTLTPVAAFIDQE